MNWLKQKARDFLDGLFRLPTRIMNGYMQFFDGVKGSWQWVHRKVAEIVQGESIPRGHEVHHVNRDKLDNDPDNLQVLTKEEHQDVHKNDYKKRLDRVNKKLTSLKTKTAKQNNRSPKINLQDRLSRIINAEKVRVDHLFSEFRSSGGSSSSCGRCGGTGYLPHFSHVSGGVCFLCGGSCSVDESSFENFEPDFREDDWEDSHFDDFDDYYNEPYDDYGDNYDPRDDYDSQDDYYDSYDPQDDPEPYNDYDDDYY